MLDRRGRTNWSVIIDAAVRAAPDDPLDRIEAVVRAVFRPAVRRPALLGLVREVSRLPSAAGRPVAVRPARWSIGPSRSCSDEMDAGRLRRADPRSVASLCYATVTGIATEPEALRAVGWQPTAAGLRRLRNELLAFLRAALAALTSHESFRVPTGCDGTSLARNAGQWVVLRRRRAWRSRARRTSSSISSA